jgi:hypothetical protein
MRNKVIIELELLTPLKYDKLIVKDDPFSDLLYEVAKIHKVKSTVRNTVHLGKPDYEDMNRAEKSVVIGSLLIRGLLDDKTYTYNMVEFKGLSELEESNYCSLMYLVTNSQEPEVMSFLKTFVASSNRECYIIRTDLDDKTIGTFKDMFEEL